MKYLIWFNLMTLSVFGQEEQFQNTLQATSGSSSPAASLEIMDWLHGEWIGEGLGGYCEEIWSKAVGGSMLGVFRMVKDDKPVFTEFMEIRVTDGSMLLRLKHFGEDFVGWEEKDKHIEFKLVKAEKNAVYFDGLTYKKTGEDSMEVYVIISSRSGKREEKFSYTRR